MSDQTRSRRPMTDREVGRMLEDWMDTVAPGRAPERLVEASFARTVGTRQARIVRLRGLGRHAHGTASGGGARGRSWMAVLAVAATVALVAGALVAWGAGSRAPSVPPPAPSAVPAPAVVAPSPPVPATAPVPASPAATPSASISARLASPEPAGTWPCPNQPGLVRPAFASVPLAEPAGAPVALPARSDGLAYGAGSLWVGSTGDSTLRRVDPATGTVVATIALPVDVTNGNVAITPAADAIYVAAGREDMSGAVLRLDPATGRVAWSVPVAAPLGVAVSDGSLWVPSWSTDRLLRLDPTTGATRGEVLLGSSTTSQDARTVPNDVAPSGVLAADGAIWVPTSHSGELLRIDPATMRVTDRWCLAARTDLGVVTYGDGSLWLTESSRADVLRVDPRTGSVLARIALPVGPGGATAGDVRLVGDRIWVSADSYAWAIDPASDEVVSGVRILSPPSTDPVNGAWGIVEADGSVWTGTAVPPGLVRLAPAR